MLRTYRADYLSKKVERTITFEVLKTELGKILAGLFEKKKITWQSPSLQNLVGLLYLLLCYHQCYVVLKLMNSTYTNLKRSFRDKHDGYSIYKYVVIYKIAPYLIICYYTLAFL